MNSWNIHSDFKLLTNYAISGHYRQEMINQLSNNNRFIVRYGKDWSSNDFTIDSCYVKYNDGHWCIWLTNDERRKLYRNLNERIKV